ncbi:hypothetical protein I4F81_001275 [Pyropia yezoensis]|uniref:Uncharacterized protein n=1 Tax=Pyropia yezoensis TaxID=2788 RepID=A0ACC3BL41_PYRYE|nr:hypothetical protein I4F81_001275 [Neopyropia yezoensis]
MLAEPAINVFGGCDLVDVQLLGHALANGVPSSEWLGLAQCVRNVVFVWHFLLLVKRRMDEDPLLAHAVGELILFAASRGPAATDLWDTKASEAAKEYRAMWQDTSAEQYQEWAAAQGVKPAVTHIVGHAAVQARILEQAEEERTGQAWPGRKLALVPLEIQHQTVESYYHNAMVDRCEVTGCNCREGIPAGQSLGLEKKL